MGASELPPAGQKNPRPVAVGRVVGSDWEVPGLPGQGTGGGCKPGGNEL